MNLRSLTGIVVKTIAVLMVALVFGVLAVYFFVNGVHVEKDNLSGQKRENAIWLAHEWVGNYKTREEVHNLLIFLRERRISRIFVHSGPLNADGSIDYFDISYAKEFLKNASELAPDIKVDAWLGQKRGLIDLSEGAVRNGVVATSKRLVDEFGFEGVHLNIEPMQSDRYFLKLAQEVKSGLGETELSATISPIVPKFEAWLLQFALGKKHFFGNDLSRDYNSISYIKELSEHLDTVVLMAYDTGLRDSTLYKWFLEQELIFLTRSAGDKSMIGIPAYEDERANFDSNTENMENALNGVLQALSNVRVSQKKLKGVAIYSHWTTDFEEWEIWDRIWLNK